MKKMNIDTAILQGIRTAVARRLGKHGHKVSVTDDHQKRGITINPHCSFVLSGSKLIKNCEAELTIDLANPNYLDYIVKAIKFCEYHYQWCNCSEIIDEWHKMIKGLK